MNFIESFNNKTILIPLLQRDYVQGGREEVISPFMDSLLDKKCDLNYIYGYEQDSCFVPVDGQQRLTTLWLLYLYLYARKKQMSKFNILMKFESREYAEDFCEKLLEHLEALLGNVNDNVSLDEEIENQNWFIRSWLTNASVKNMLNTLKVIHRKINKDKLPSVWSRLVESSTPSISFAFLQMSQDNGLDDDIYIKMNGRGRRLSVFENLKSFMDEHVGNLSFAHEWRDNIDNTWTDMFWRNRNLQQEHPEEIDDEQLYCLYNLLILYHIGSDELLGTVADIKENDDHLYEDLLTFFCKGEKDMLKDIVSAIIDRLQYASNFPLVWFERLNLLSAGFYEFAFDKMNRLEQLSEELNQMSLYIGASPSDKTWRTYQLAMCESSFDRTLPLLYALLCYNVGATAMFDWMRTMRNLILNTSIDRSNLPQIMQTIKNFCAACMKENIYEVLQHDEVKSLLKGFSGAQISEEILKASMPEYYEQMVRIENGRFFSGRIGLMFRLLSVEEKEGYDTLSLDNVKAYTSVLLTIFDGSDGGITQAYDDEHFYLRRALMTYRPYYFGKERNGYWSFSKGMDEWRDYLNDKNADISALRSLLKENLVPAEKSGKNTYEVLAEYVEAISKQYEQDIIAKDNDSHRFHFIHHSGVWRYMSTQRCMWTDNNYDIELKTSNGNRSNRMELRTYSLYLDYKHCDDYADDTKGWTVGKWQVPARESCFYFNLNTPVNKRTIAIDVYFYDDEGQRKSEDNYAFDLFVRPTHSEPENENERKDFVEEDYKLNLSVFSNVLSKDMDLLCRKSDGRLHSKRLYSRHELKTVLKNIMERVNAVYGKTEKETAS